MARAIGGDDASLAWLVGRFSPVLLSLARRRLGPTGRAAIEPEDVVAEVWAVALPKLEQLDVDDGRHAAVLMKFLATSLVRFVNRIIERQIRHQRLAPQLQAADTDRRSLVESLPAQTSGVITASIRGESVQRVLDELDRLDPQDRDIVLLCGVEQRPRREAAAIFALSEAAVASRYTRARRRIREALPDTVFDDLPE